MCGGFPKTWASGRSGDRPLRFVRVAVLFIKTPGTAHRTTPTIDSRNIIIYRGNTVTKSFCRGRSPDHPAALRAERVEKNVRLSAVFKSALCAGAFQKHGPRDDLGIVPYVLLGWRFCLLRPPERHTGRSLRSIQEMYGICWDNADMHASCWLVARCCAYACIFLFFMLCLSIINKRILRKRSCL